MYTRSSFEHSPHLSSHPTIPPQPLLEFHFGSLHRIAFPFSTPLPFPYHFRTKFVSPYIASSNALARLYQKTPGVRILKFSKTVSCRPAAINASPYHSGPPRPLNSLAGACNRQDDKHLNLVELLNFSTINSPSLHLSPAGACNRQNEKSLHAVSCRLAAIGSSSPLRGPK